MNIINKIYIIFISFILNFILNKLLIFIFSKYNIFQNIRYEGPKSHFKKKYTPTMSGINIFIMIFFHYYFFLKKNNIYLNTIILLYFLNFLIGFLDDILKIVKKNSNIIKLKHKIILQFLIYNIIIFFNKKILYKNIINIPFLNIKFYTNKIINYFFYFIIINGFCNSVNITDGLDGLVSFPLILIYIILILILYLSIYNNNFSLIHKLFFIDLISIFMNIIGCLLSFLWFNSYPANIFLGDVGSLPLGSIIGFSFIILNKELLSIVPCFLLFIESMSTIIQIFTYNFFNKFRFFLMAPIHHHYELKNIHENKIVVRFWILSILLFLISLILII
ncbi:phospho-N-acetylmuramoyl-pentapeptide-transferase [Candidatus Nardonella dryophthoridicola]|uniref:Phospho-N-acetylmuramoyl-pentapeptide-transferase n=1 Tax=endosymbiont of Rhynchophorus ferrugineus TaxID=1972133 RepID=A0A2Z5T3K7_9GAMM|nr:phospho-N-acetylmuramoyl-pentapeptide-transferase [Candidatus Nardonella dryophthoridicola]BBA84977.1 phospho-N-acetylmuramoyl-pentapeptide-transferase [endosymbiont of Rhynchophorus ferrugineus]